MALIGKIRKNFWFVLILLGLALAAFILMDMTSASNAGGAATSMNIGSVGSEKIDYRAFQQTEQAYYSNSQSDAFTKRKSIWDFYVEKAVLKKEAGALGLNISHDELMELQFGNNPSPIITQNWRNPQTGQVDQASLQQFKTAIENNEEMNPQFRAYWAEQEKQIIKESLQGKLNNLVGKSVYTPNWMAEESFSLNNNTIDFNYVKIPFDQIDGTGIEVSDADITNYIAGKKNRYDSPVEKRVIEYASFNVLATAADSAAIRDRMTGLKNEFRTSQDDSLFTLSNSGTYSHLYAKADQIPEGVRTQVTAMNPGEVFGPFHNQGYYMVFKMLDKKLVADTVEARHILKSAVRDDATSVAKAKSTIDSIRRALASGVSFDTLALRHSDDPSNKATGGSLGKFDQTRMVPEFTTACFANGKKGGIYTIQTDFGIHLLEVQSQIFNDSDPKYRLASITTPIVPSQETQDETYDLVTEIVSNNRDINALRTAIGSQPNVIFEKSNPLIENDYNLGNLGSAQSSRDIIKWAFDLSTEVGDVSPEIYRYTDPVNYYDNKYVLATLNTIMPKGLPSAAAMRSELAVAVMNQKKAQKFAAGLSYNGLNELVTQHNVELQTASNVGYNTTVPGIGNDKSVVARAFATGVQAVSKPIVGETGVFVVQPISKQEPGAATDLVGLKNSIAGATKSQVNFSLIKNMKKRADIKDERKNFF